MGGGSSKPAAAAATPAQTISAGAPTAPAPVQTKPAATPEPQAAAPATPSQPQAAPQSQAGDFERGLVKGEQKVLERAQAAVDTVVATAKLEIQRQKDEAAAAERAALEKWLKEAKKDMYRAPQRPLGCHAERMTVLECYNRRPFDAAQCVDVVDAFQACSRKGVEALMKPGSQ